MAGDILKTTFSINFPRTPLNVVRKKRKYKNKITEPPPQVSMPKHLIPVVGCCVLMAAHAYCLLSPEAPEPKKKKK